MWFGCPRRPFESEDLLAFSQRQTEKVSFRSRTVYQTQSAAGHSKECTDWGPWDECHHPLVDLTNILDWPKIHSPGFLTSSRGYSMGIKYLLRIPAFRSRCMCGATPSGLLTHGVLLHPYRVASAFSSTITGGGVSVSLVLPCRFCTGQRIFLNPRLHR